MAGNPLCCSVRTTWPPSRRRSTSSATRKPWPTSATRMLPMLAATLSAAPTRYATCAVPPEQPNELVLAPPAVRAVTADLPEAVAAAVVEFMTGVLVHNPHRVGRPLGADL